MIATCGGKVVFRDVCTECGKVSRDLLGFCDAAVCLDCCLSVGEKIQDRNIWERICEVLTGKTAHFVAGSLAGVAGYLQSNEVIATVAQVQTQQDPNGIINPNVDITHAFDPIISLLQQLAFPVAITVIGWGCLEAMIGKPASAVNRIKWAVLGYLAMRYLPGIFRGL